MTFACSQCKATHPAVYDAREEMDLSKLRADWIKASDRHSPSIGSEVGEHELKTSLAYFGKMKNNVPKVPETMKSMHSANGYALVCVECHKE